MAPKRKPGSTPTKDEAMRLMDMPSGDWSSEEMEDFIAKRREIIEDDGGWVYALSPDGTIEILVEGAGGKGNAKGVKLNKGKAYDAIMQKFKGVKPKATTAAAPEEDPEFDPNMFSFRTPASEEDLPTSPAVPDAPSKPVDVDLDKMNPLGDYAQKLMESAAALSDRLQAKAYDKSTEWSDTPVSDHADAVAKAVGELSTWLKTTDLAPGLFGDVRHDGGPAATKAAELNAEVMPSGAERDAAREELDYIESLNFGVKGS